MNHWRPNHIYRLNETRLSAYGTEAAVIAADIIKTLLRQRTN